MFNQYAEGKECFKLYGVNEQSLKKAAEAVEKMSSGGVKLSFTLCKSDAFVEIVNQSSTAVVFDSVIKSFINAFSSFIYANENISLQENAVALLKISGKKLCTAESFTGGAVANAIVSVAGASEVFYEGFVCYNTGAKIQRLGVSEQTVRAHTVVSREVAFEMVKGLLQNGNCDVAVATTGYASPTGDAQKPAGLCFIAVANEQKAEVFRYNFSGTREQIIEQGKNSALFALNRILRG